MRYPYLILAVILLSVACGKKAADVVTDTIVDCLLPCDATATDAPATATPTDATATAGDATTTEG